MASTFGSPYPDHYVRLPNAFYDGDQISIEAVGSCTSKKGATNDVCQKLLSLLLAIALEKVHLCASGFIDDHRSIELLVDEAKKAHLELVESRESPLNEEQLSLTKNHAEFPLPRSRPLATSSAQKTATSSAIKTALADGIYRHLANKYEPLGDGIIEQQKRDEEIVQICSLCGRRGKKGIFDPSRAPPR